MKRKLLALLLASVMVLSLVACGQKETPDTPETPDDQEEVKDYSGYTIRIYSNSNSTERTTWLIQEAKDAGFTISIDDNSVISGDTAAIQAANENKDGDILFGLNETRWSQVVDGVYENLKLVDWTPTWAGEVGEYAYPGAAYGLVIQNVLMLYRNDELGTNGEKLHFQHWADIVDCGYTWYRQNKVGGTTNANIKSVKDLKGKTVVVSGAGNVATYAIEKAWQLGAKPVTCSDSTGWIYDPDGIDVATLIDVKQVKRARLTEYAKARPKSVYHEGKGVWTTKCDVALPCATQNELLLDDAKALVANGCFAVVEGANMPTSLDATKYLQEQGILFCPGKAANAGGVATSALEMTQNSQRLSWTFEEVDAKLKDIMVNIFHNLDAAAKEYGMEGNYVAGANIAGFLKVADAMQAQGIV